MREAEPSITSIGIGDVHVSFGANAAPAVDYEEAGDDTFDFRDRSLHSEVSGVDADLRAAWEQQKARQDAKLTPQEKQLDLDGWFRQDYPQISG